MSSAARLVNWTYTLNADPFCSVVIFSDDSYTIVGDVEVTAAEVEAMINAADVPGWTGA